MDHLLVDDFPVKMVIFHSYISLPEGKHQLMMIYGGQKSTKNWYEKQSTMLKHWDLMGFEHRLKGIDDHDLEIVGS